MLLQCPQMLHDDDSGCKQLQAFCCFEADKVLFGAYIWCTRSAHVVILQEPFF